MDNLVYTLTLLIFVHFFGILPGIIYPFLYPYVKGYLDRTIKYLSEKPKQETVLRRYIKLF